jgi:hypothetical protein
LIRTPAAPDGVAAVLLAIAAGAAAAFDPSDRPRLDLLLVFTVGAIALVLADRAWVAGRRSRHVAWMACAALAALGLVIARGWPAFWTAALGILGARAYRSGPELAGTRLAGPAVVILLGILPSAGAAMALVGHAETAAWAAGLPLGFLAEAVRRSEREPLGARPGRGVLIATGAAFGSLLAFAVRGNLPLLALVALGALPWAVHLVALARLRTPIAVAPDPIAEDRHRADAEPRLEVATAAGWAARRARLVFGLLLVAALAAARLAAVRAV